MLVLATAGCDRLFGIAEFPPDPDAAGRTGWLEPHAHRKRVEVLQPANRGPLHDYPLGLAITADGDLAAAAASDGSDLVATASDGVTPLALEVESYAAGTLAAWVRLPELAGPMAFYLYYGGPARTGAASDVWSSDVAGVWHFADADAASLRDSAASHADFTQPVAASQAARTAGVFGAARHFDGNDSYAYADGGASSPLAPGLGSFSYTAWISIEAAPSDTYAGVLYKGASTTSDAGIDVKLDRDTWRADIADGAQDSIGHADICGGNASALDNTWHFVAVVADRDVTQRLTTFLDGIEQQHVDIGVYGAPQRALTMRLGSLANAQGGMIGRLDEVRLYRTALSPAWLATDYHDGALVLTTVGPEESR